ncbi:outer membrane protein assembly factor BamB [Acidovorax sp. Leaf76]|uniref:outer membrane protein assembly factor BamB n=1 Tax=unclassified Acidovorax TaxID=2684926 RepID=UPI0006F4D05D|nr:MULTISPECIES: outer membrane protein assembly factor BamB [unclassified Acidovorax]KQO25845.1 outer membrane protein assembly factor BamB [Acidovorax sp. Leaf76]KQO28694.1 outer membrane protein assembly factor BamB [Acidovorax sp. Leaf84]KQS40627.1 outer membrane protein assembly factor BamB [Acidovorax sp. Leaf191]
MNFVHSNSPVGHRLFVRSVCSALLLGALAGCSLWNSGSSKPVPADLGANVAVLGVRQAWTARIGNVGGLPLDVHAAGNVVTLASADGVVAAVDARTGGDLWRATLAEPLSAGVGSDGKSAAVVLRSNALVLLESGRERWREPLAAQVFTPPLVAGGRVFVLSADRSVAAYDGATGRKLWSQQRPGEALVLRQAGVLLAVGDTLVVGFSGRMVGLNPDNGSVRWEAPLGSSRGTNDVERLVELVGRTSRVGDSICARAFQTAVGCVNAARGSTIWTQAASGAEGVHGDGDAVFGSESNGSVIAWRRSDGSRLWATDRLKYRKLTAPLLLGRSVVVGDDSGLVHLLSRTDGAPLNRVATDGSGIAAAPVVAADTLVVVTRNGGVYGFRPD